MKYVIRSINVLSVGKFAFLYFFLLGLFLDIVFAAVFGIPPERLNNSALFSGTSPLGTVETVMLLFTFAVTFGACMALFAALVTLIYNLTSGAFGGICVSMKKDSHIDTDVVTTIKKSASSREVLDG